MLATGYFGDSSTPVIASAAWQSSDWCRANGAQNFYRGAASAETDELCTLNFELFITLAM